MTAPPGDRWRNNNMVRIVLRFNVANKTFSQLVDAEILSQMYIGVSVNARVGGTQANN